MKIGLLIYTFTPHHTDPGPTLSPTIPPTPAPTLVQPGQCSLPYTLNLGANSFNNAPATGLTLSTVGTTCNFGATGDQGR